MTQTQERLLRKRIDETTLETVAKEASVSVLTVAKVLARLPVNDSGARMVTMYAAGLRERAALKEP